MCQVAHNKSFQYEKEQQSQVILIWPVFTLPCLAEDKTGQEPQENIFSKIKDKCLYPALSYSRQDS